MANLSTTIILKALDCLSLRATALAQNIANANTSNYSPVRVSFEKALADAASHGDGAVSALQPRILHDAAASGDMRVDLEVANASATALRYAALIEVLNHRLQRDSLAISGNL